MRDRSPLADLTIHRLAAADPDGDSPQRPAAAAPAWSVDAATFARHYYCPDCEVGWHDVSSTCFACERDVSVLSHPLGTRDAARMDHRDSAGDGTPLTRFGPRVDHRPTTHRKAHP